MRKILILAIAGILLVGCGGDADEALPTLAAPADDNGSEQTTDNTSNDDTNQTGSSGATVDVGDVAAGDYSLTISGDVSSIAGIDSVETSDPIEYDPLPRDSGNTYGRHRVIMFTDADITNEQLISAISERGGEVEAPVPFRAKIEFPHDIAPGTYDIMEDGMVEAEVQYGESSFSLATFDDDLGGTLTVENAGESLTASFTINATLSSDYSIEASGVINDVPFSYDRQLTLNITEPKELTISTEPASADTIPEYYLNRNIDEEVNPVEWNFIFGEACCTDGFENIVEVTLFVQEGTPPGTYDINPAGTSVSESNPVRIEDFEFDHEPDDISIDAEAEASGTFTFEYTETGTMQGSFDITGTDADTGETLTVNGTFAHMDPVFTAENN
jgi:hypothetical protein